MWKHHCRFFLLALQRKSLTCQRGYPELTSPVWPQPKIKYSQLLKNNQTPNEVSNQQPDYKERGRNDCLQNTEAVHVQGISPACLSKQFLRETAIWVYLHLIFLPSPRLQRTAISSCSWWGLETAHPVRSTWTSQRRSFSSKDRCFAADINWKKTQSKQARRLILSTGYLQFQFYVLFNLERCYSSDTHLQTSIWD